MSDMKHMEHLEAVAASDVAVLRKKEATYQGSWKAAGGRSAWFMARRNLDRLLVMMAAPSSQDVLQTFTDNIHGAEESNGEISVSLEDLKKLRQAYVSEDIFLKILENPSGADGTVLAVMRDARRYFALVEAEMVARGVVRPEHVEKTFGSFRVTSVSEHKPDQLVEIMSAIKELYSHRGDLGDGPDTIIQGIAKLAKLTGVDRAFFEKVGEATSALTGKTHDVLVERKVPRRVPDDDPPHASTSPWIVSRDTFQAMERPAQDCYDLRAQNVYKLTPCLTEPQHFALGVSMSKVARSASGCYAPLEKAHVLRIENAPREQRTMWPVLRRECNAHEHEALPAWQQMLYEWITSGTGYRIRPEHAAWTEGDYV